MASRHSGAWQHNASSCNPLTGEASVVRESAQVSGARAASAARDSLPFFVKHSAGQPAYQPNVRSTTRSSYEDSIAKPISSPQKHSAIVRHVDDTYTLSQPVSSEHVLRRRAPEPQAALASVVHMHTPPPFATSDVIISHARRPSTLASPQGVRAAGVASSTNGSQSARTHRNATSQDNVMRVDDLMLAVPRSPAEVRQLQSALRQLERTMGASSIHAGGGGDDDEDYQLPVQRTPSYLHATSSSSQRTSRNGSRVGSRQGSRQGSRHGSRRNSLTLNLGNLVLQDAQVSPQNVRYSQREPNSPTSPLTAFEEGASPDILPAAGARLTILAEPNRPISEKERIHFLGSSVVLSHPEDFVATDVGKMRSHQKKVLSRVTSANQEMLAEQLRWASANTSGTQTPAYSPHHQRQRSQDSSAASSPSKRRTNGWGHHEDAERQHQEPAAYQYANYEDEADVHSAPVASFAHAPAYVNSASVTSSSPALVSNASTAAFPVMSAYEAVEPRTAGIPNDRTSNRFAYNFVPVASPVHTAPGVAAPTYTSSVSIPTAAVGSRSSQIEQLQSQLLKLQHELRNIHSEASTGMSTPALRVAPANASMFEQILRANSGQVTPAPAHAHAPIPAPVVIGNSATGFRPMSPLRTPGADLNGHQQPDVITSRAPAGRPPVAKSHVNGGSVGAPPASQHSEAYSIARPPAPPSRFHSSVHASSLDPSLNRIVIEHEAAGRGRVEERTFLHPDDEDLRPARTGDVTYHSTNGDSAAVPMGGPLLYDRYEAVPVKRKPRVGPGPAKKHPYYLHSELSPPIIVRPKKPETPKLWKV